MDKSNEEPPGSQMTCGGDASLGVCLDTDSGHDELPCHTLIHDATHDPPPKFLKVGRFGNCLVNTAISQNRTSRQQLQLIRPRAEGAPTFARVAANPETHDCIGGMRNPLKSLAMLPPNNASPAVRREIDRFLDSHPDVQTDVMASIASNCSMIRPSDSRLDVLRVELAKILHAKSINGVCSELYNTSLRADLLYAWASRARDPARDAATWLWSGAPAGIIDHVPDWGIFPKSGGDGAEVEHAELFTDYEGFENYSSVDDDPAAEELVTGLLDETKQWVKSFSSVGAATEFLGGPPILSKLHMITKEKRDISGKLMRIKRRLRLQAV